MNEMDQGGKNRFVGKKYKTAELLLKKGARNVIWNLLHTVEDYPTKLKLIERHRNIKDELDDLIIMEKLGLFKQKRTFISISNIIEYYKDNADIRKCIESILEKFHLYRAIDTSINPLLWNYHNTFLAEYFQKRNIEEKISICRLGNYIKVS